MSGGNGRRSVARVLFVIAMAVALGACGRGAGVVRSKETIAAEAKAGDFADYWAEVVRLSRRHAAHPDSFRAAIDALPGTHLTDAEWDAWIAPYRARPGDLASRLEQTMTEMTPPPPPGTAPGGARVRADSPPVIPEGTTPPPATPRPADTGR